MLNLSGTSLQTDMVEAASPILKPGLESALLIGAAADQILRKPGFDGRVISVGSKAAFIVSSQGAILAFSQPDQQPHPRAVLSGRRNGGFVIRRSIGYGCGIT